MTEKKETPTGQGEGNKNTRKPERYKKERAKKASNQVRPRLKLYEPDPWTEPVDGALLLDEIVSMISRRVSLPKGAAEAIALWVLFTHAFAAAGFSPRLAFVSPVPECGKTTTFDVIACMVPRPLPTSNASPAVIFRVIERVRPTLFFDEADTFMDGRDELAGILNSGHAKTTALVLRCRTDDFEPEYFSTWTPIAIARIGELAPALRSRSIVIPMQRARADEAIEKPGPDTLPKYLEIGRKAARWARDHLDALRTAEPVMPEGFHHRLADNWRFMLAIADLAGGHWPETARSAALRLSGEMELPKGVQLLFAIRSVFEATSAGRFSSADLCKELKSADDQSRWTPNGVARALKPFRIRPHGVRIGDKTPKGYYLSDFEDAFARYLPPVGGLPAPPP